MEAKEFIENYYDYLAPKLDTYEQAIYLYIYRHSRLQEKDEVTIGFKSARNQIALGTGKKGSALSDRACYMKLQSLEEKGCLKVVGTERAGTRIRLFLPNEIPDLIESQQLNNPIDLENMDFFTIPENRLLILEREGNRCFYCMVKLNKINYVIEHVISRPEGNNSYRNLVASCLKCNNHKKTLAEDLIRTLHRDGFLSADEFEARLSHLEQLRDGKLKPQIKGG